MIFGNSWITRYLVLCTPSYVLFTSLNMSEALTICLIFGALASFKRENFLIATLLLGLAIITRPQSVFLLYIVLVFLIYQQKHQNRQRVLLLILIPLSFLGGELFFNHFAFGNSLINFKGYTPTIQGNLFWVPFKNLIIQSQNSAIPSWKKIYVWMYVCFVLGGLFLLYRNSRSQKFDFIRATFLYWGFLHCIFYLSLGSSWAFHDLPRYLLPVFPGAFLGFERWLPKSWNFTFLLLFLCILLSVFAEAY